MSREELKESGAQKMILARLDELEDDVAELSEFRDEYYRVDKEVAVLRERVKRSTTFEVLYGVVLVTGPLLIGLAPSVSAWLAIPGGLLLLGAIIARLLWPSTANGGAS
ncbi:MAG: hypothetical protein F4X99_12020 [Gammaproteobacteria bacterium]|nr:hypothetical protein [Gammaproteobacteria bacterium]